MWPVESLSEVKFHDVLPHDAGAGAYQTLMKKVSAPGYPSRTDIATHVVTLQVPLEGSLQTGGIAFVLKTGQQQWLASRSEGVLRSDFFISTEQVYTVLWLIHSELHAVQEIVITPCLQLALPPLL